MSQPMPPGALNDATFYLTQDLMPPELKRYWQDRALRMCEDLASILGRHWRAQPYGYDGCALAFARHASSKQASSTVIVSRASDLVSEWGAVWLHASIAHANHMPSYQELAALHKAVFGEGFAYQVFATTERHVDLHSFALHLWGLESGKNALPDFGFAGTI